MAEGFVRPRELLREFPPCHGCVAGIQDEAGSWRCTERRAYKPGGEIGKSRFKPAPGHERYPRFPPGQKFAFSFCQGRYFSKFDQGLLPYIADVASLSKRVKDLEDQVREMREEKS